MLRRKRGALTNATGADALWPLGKPSNLVEIVVEEDKHRNRTELATVQIVIHQVGMLVAQKDAQVEFPTLGCEPTKDWQIVDDVTAPVLGQDEHMKWSRQALERFNDGGIENQVALIRDETLLVARHL